MRLAGGLHRMVRILVALLVFAGASSQSIAALLCPLMPCAKAAPASAVPVQAQPPVSEMAADHSCCAGGGESRKAGDSIRAAAPEANCCCEIAPASTPAVKEAKFSLPSAVEWTIALPEAPVLREFEAITRLSARIPNASDSSPPKRPAAPDRGRAPPRA